MLIEQMILAHHRLVNLQRKADEASTLEAIKVLNAAVVRLMGEFRRCALAIRQYRLPPGQKQFNLIKEQNIQVNSSPSEETLSKQSQLNSDDPLARRMHGTHTPATGRKEKLEEPASLVG